MGASEVASKTGISRMLSRWNYQRIGRDPWHRSGARKTRTVKLTGPKQPRSSWRLRLVPKLRLRLISPKSFLKRFRDAYCNMLIAFSTKRNNVGMVMGQHMNSSRASFPSKGTQMSNKDLQRLYTAYLRKAVAEESQL